MDELKTMNTDELMAAYHAALVDSSVSRRRCLDMFHELQRRKERCPDAYRIYEELYSAEELTDPTGTKLTPSWHGEKCLGNGEHGLECCCDECDFYLACFPDWEDYKEQG